MYEDLEMMRSSEIERRKMKRLQLVALIPLICATCGPLSLAAGAFSKLLTLAMVALCAMGTPFGILIGPLVLNLRKDLYVIEEDRPLFKRVKIFAILDIILGLLCVLIMLALFLAGGSV